MPNDLNFITATSGVRSNLWSCT